jgi:hypothetical protein
MQPWYALHGCLQSMAVNVKPVRLESQLQQDKDMEYWNVSIHEIAKTCADLGVRLDRVPVSNW